MVAGQAADLRARQHAGLAKNGRKAPVGGGLAVLRQVAGGQQQVGTFAVGFNLAQHRAQARVGIDAQHRGVGFAEQMAVGQLDEHGGRVVTAGQRVDAWQVPLLRSLYVCTLPKKQGAARISSGT
ncbi:hypothetical protein D3C71_1581800 [compost metagenome]